MVNLRDHRDIVATTEVSRAPPTAAVASLLPSQRSSLYRHARVIVVMGVCGTGKSTLGKALAEALHIPFIDGDDLHPAANVAKMSRGVPLDDADRQPWLETIRTAALANVVDQMGVTPVGKPLMDIDAAWQFGVIVACSALKQAYRVVLRGAGSDPVSLPTYFVYMKGDEAVLMERMRGRTGHFMKAGMLASQLGTLESPEGESGVVTVDVEMSTEEQVQKVVDAFRMWARPLGNV